MNQSHANNDFFPLISIRLTPPVPASTGVPRSRLIDKIISLESKQSARPVVTVVAPAGYGKSSLLSQCYSVYVDAGWYCTWLTLEEDDNYSGHFFFYFNALVSQLESQLDASTDLNDKDQIDGRILSSRLIRLAGITDKSIAIFLDDYHVITNKDINDSLLYLLKHLPDNIKIFIGSRLPIPVPLAKFRVANKLLSIDVNELSFDTNEVRILFNDINQLELGDESYHLLFEKTRGWPALLQLAAISAKGADDPMRFVESFSGSNEIVEEYLEEEILAVLPDETANYLLKSSIVDRFCSPLCDALNDMPSSNIKLEQLNEVRYFIQSLDVDKYWFQLHPLFRAFLNRQLQARMGNEVRTLHKNASRWFEEEGLIASAIQHSINAGDDSHALELLEEQGMHLMQKGVLQLLFSLIDRLPDSLLEKSHDILIQLAWLEIVSMNFSQAEVLLTQIGKILEGKQESHMESWAELQTAQAILYCHNENFMPVPAIVDKWLPKMETCPNYVVAVMRMAKTFYSLSHYDFHTAKQQVNEIVLLLNEPALSMSYAYGVSLRKLNFYAEADLERADILLQADQNAIEDKVGSDSDAVHMMDSILGAIHYMRGSSDSAHSLLLLGDDTEKKLASVEMMLVVFPCRLRILVNSRRPQDALQYLLQVQERAKEKNWLRLEACVLHEHVKMLLEVGSTKQASKQVDEWLMLHKHTGNAAVKLDYVAECLSMTNARLALALGDDVKAAVLVKAIIEQSIRQNRLMRQLECMVLLGRIYAMSGKRSEATNILREALQIDTECSVIQLYRDEGKQVLEVLGQLLTQLEKRVDPDKDLSLITYIHTILTPSVPSVPSAPSQGDVSSKVKPALVPGGEAYKMVESLTNRELATLELLAEGLSNKEIADKLCIGINTVKTHLHFSYGKLGVTRRTQAVRRLKEMGVFD